MDALGIEVVDSGWLLHPESRRPYVQVNKTNEVNAIASRLVNISVYDAFPQVQPDVEELLQHAIARTLDQSPAYPTLQQIPGLNQLPDQMIATVARELS